MQDIVKKIISPLLSLFIFALCSGFFVTLISLAMHDNHETPLMIGAMSGVFYIGIVCGAFRMEPFIARVGHIRAFSTFASALAVMSLMHGLFYNIPLWFVLRFLTGFGTAGIFVVIESWLLFNSNDANRGRILSIYMVIFYASEAFGQFLINLDDPNHILLYAISAMLCSLSIIPLCMTSVPMPELVEPSTMRLRTLFKKSPSAFLGSFSAGMILSAAYGLFPVLFAVRFTESSKIALIMFCLIIGGMIVQYPVGKLSDTYDRRLVVIVICFISSITAAFLLGFLDYFYLSLALIMLLGGLATTIYPISVSYACDTLASKDIVAGIQGLLLAYSLGAVLGPFIAPLFMHFKPIYLFIYFIILFVLTMLIFIWSRTQKEGPPQEDPFRVMRQSTPVAAEIDPRSD